MASVSLTIRIADMPSTRLLLFTLEEVASDMRVAADPFAGRLTEALDRFERNVRMARADDEPEAET